MFLERDRSAGKVAGNPGREVRHRFILREPKKMAVVGAAGTRQVDRGE